LTADTATKGKMAHYEMILILDGNRDEETTKAEIEKIGETITSNGGTMGEVDPWGKRKLAYEIKDRREGFYVSVFFQGNEETIRELERALKLNEAVLRHLTLSHDPSRPAPSAPPVERERDRDRESDRFGRDRDRDRDRRPRGEGGRGETRSSSDDEEEDEDSDSSRD